MSSPGRELLAAPPGHWAQWHRDRRPESLAPCEAALNRLLARILAGEPVVELAPGHQGDHGPVRLRLRGLGEEDRSGFARLAVPPEDEHRVPAGGVDLAGIRLPELVRREPRWTMSAAGFGNYVELTSLDAVICERLLAPVMADLAYVLRLRAGEGPKSAKGRAERLARCRHAHDVLGLHDGEIVTLISPDLDAKAVVSAREALITSWARHPPNIGERAVALLCGQLAQVYYRKARKDGTVEAARVLTARVAAQLEATLGDWPTLVEYLGELQAAADATPIATPETTLPTTPPPQVAERLSALHDWWAIYDARHAAQRAGLEPLTDLVPSRWDYRPADEDSNGRDRLEVRAPGEDLLARMETLWGSQVLDRYPDTLVDEPRPLGIFAELVQPAAGFWDELSLTAWFSCFGRYSRHTLDELEEFQRDARRELEGLGAPVDPSLYGDLLAIATEYPFLIEQHALAVEISIAIGLDGDGQPTIDSSMKEPEQRFHPEVFEALRDIITRHRRTWIERYLERYLNELWRRDLAAAATAYWKRFRGRGRAPTVKQALPDVKAAARHWFGADHGELARLLHLDGPIAVSPVPTPRGLPTDLAALQDEVAAGLAASAMPSDDGRDREYDLQRLAQQAATILVVWQATGATPPRTAVLGSGYRWLVEQNFDLDLDRAYGLLLQATHEALKRRGHPAAANMLFE